MIGARLRSRRESVSRTAQGCGRDPHWARATCPHVAARLGVDRPRGQRPPLPRCVVPDAGQPAASTESGIGVVAIQRREGVADAEKPGVPGTTQLDGSAIPCPVITSCPDDPVWRPGS
jgi:hypothetical protein